MLHICVSVYIYIFVANKKGRALKVLISKSEEGIHVGRPGDFVNDDRCCCWKKARQRPERIKKSTQMKTTVAIESMTLIELAVPDRPPYMLVLKDT